MPVVAGQGGRFASLVGSVEDGLTAHHLPQTALGFTSRLDGGALVMTTAEHEATRTFGFRGAITKVSEANAGFRAVLARDICDIRSIVGKRYNHGLRYVLHYYRKHYPGLMQKMEAQNDPP